MTRDEIMNMPAGREMDALIAELVMGEAKPIYSHDHAIVTAIKWSGGRNWYCLPEFSEGDICEWKPADFSSFIGSAWLVVEKMVNFSITIESFPKGVLCRFFDAGPSTAGDFVGWGDTAPLAICRAALLCCLTKG